MSTRLEIKKVNNPSYATLRQKTENFQQPVIITLSDNDKRRVQQLKTVLFDFERNHKLKVLNTDENFSSFSEKLVDYTDFDQDSTESNYSSTSFVFLTKDKIISPIPFASDEYISTVENITEFCFNTPFFRERLADASFLQKLLLFFAFRKGIFGKFNLSNLSNIVNINTWYSHGDTNTFIHADHGLSNLFLQLEGIKQWWIASPFQNKDLLQEVFSCDSTAINLDDSSLGELEYYHFELNKEEILYIPPNWLHGVVAPKGLNLSLSFRFPMGIREAFNNLIYWKSIGVPLNNVKKSLVKEDKSLADVRREQAEAFNQLKFYLQEHKFSTRKILNEEPEVIYRLYDLEQVNEVVTGA